MRRLRARLERRPKRSKRNGKVEKLVGARLEWKDGK